MSMRQKNIKNFYQKVSILSGIIALTAMQSAQAAGTISKIDSTPIDVVASSKANENRAPSKTVDGKSLTYDDDPDVPENWTYKGGASSFGENENWTSAFGTSVDDQWIIFDLKNTYSGLIMNVANFDTSNGDLRGRGLKEGDIYYSDSVISDFDSTSYAPNFADHMVWTSLGTKAFNETGADNTDSSGSPITTYHEFQEIDLGVTARYIAIDINTNHGDASFVGLNEVQFFGAAIPEPTSTAFILMGTVLAVVGLRRRCNFS